MPLPLHNFLPNDPLPPELRITLAYCAASLRPAMASFFALDRRFGQIVRRTSEPALGQLRLAWWRDQLTKAPVSRPAGDAVLDAVSAHCRGWERALQQHLDGWELLLASEGFDAGEAARICAMRAAPLAHFALQFGGRAGELAQVAGTRWAAADTALNLGDGAERECFRQCGLAVPVGRDRLPQPLRGLAVLDILARRSLHRPGASLMSGRAAALVALRTGLFGR